MQLEFLKLACQMSIAKGILLNMLLIYFLLNLLFVLKSRDYNETNIFITSRILHLSSKGKDF